jgi:hypothetical protein
MDTTDLVVAALFFVVAVLYSTVGHAGASGYLAVMGLVGLAPEVMRPTALLLNIAVASFTTWRFREARFFDAKALAPFVAGSLPCAFIGGTINRHPRSTRACSEQRVLVVSAGVLVWRHTRRASGRERPVKIAVPAVAIGAGIGLLRASPGPAAGFPEPPDPVAAWAGPKATAQSRRPSSWSTRSRAGGFVLRRARPAGGDVLLVGLALAVRSSSEPGSDPQAAAPCADRDARRRHGDLAGVKLVARAL